MQLLYHHVTNYNRFPGRIGEDNLGRVQGSVVGARKFEQQCSGWCGGQCGVLVVGSVVGYTQLLQTPGSSMESSA